MYALARLRKARVLALMLVPMLGGWGCASGARPCADARSTYPLDRARAAVQLAEAGDCRGVDVLIHLLEDDSAAVRMYAAGALERLCGETLGYRYFDPPQAREKAVARWRVARQRGELHLVKDAAAGQTTACTPESAP